jgi:hypothetical protein
LEEKLLQILSDLGTSVSLQQQQQQKNQSIDKLSNFRS